MEWINKLKKFDLKKIKKDNLLILLLAGLLLIVIAVPVENKETEKKETVKEAEPVIEETQTDYISVQEAKLKSILSKVEGAGEVEVMITLRASKELIIEKDTPSTVTSSEEEDSAGGKRSSSERTTNETTVYNQDSDGSTSPYVIKEIEPEIEGIIVLAKGGDDPVIAKNISDAILALFRVEAHKIKVMKLN